MQYNYGSDYDADAIVEETGNKPLVFLSARNKYRLRYLSPFVDPANNPYIVTLQTPGTSLPTFLELAVDHFSDANPKFGNQLSQALSNSRSSAEDLADALIADIKKARPSARYVVVDNFDYLEQSEASSAFFTQLANHLPKNTQVVLNGRELAYGLWSPLVRQGKAVVVGDRETFGGGIFDPGHPDKPHLEVLALAGGDVFMNGLPVTTWDGPLPRNLFYYFMDHPMVTRDEIFDTFWPDLPTKEATNVFHVTKRKISERVGADVTTYAGGFYRPSDDLVLHYDAGIFDAAVKEATDNDNDVNAWFRAIRVYRKPFLYGIDMPWVVKRREQIKLAYADALIQIGRYYQARPDDQELAVSFYLRALREVPNREDIQRSVMLLYAAQGRLDMVKQQYDNLERTLKETLNITPSKQTVQAFQKILSGAN
jgi:DNA-binding SARP family transcriptional activator